MLAGLFHSKEGYEEGKPMTSRALSHIFEAMGAIQIESEITRRSKIVRIELRTDSRMGFTLS